MKDLYQVYEDGRKDIMPLPFHCIECDKPIRQPMNGICDKCKKKEKDFIEYHDPGDEHTE